jgi:hypothetical protein
MESFLVALAVLAGIALFIFLSVRIPGFASGCFRFLIGYLRWSWRMANGFLRWFYRSV